MNLAQIFLLLLLTTIATTEHCNPRRFSSDSMVCVCDKSNCDTVTLKIPGNGEFIKYSSSRSGLRFKKEMGKFTTSKRINGTLIEIDSSIRHKKIVGFGGHFTDSTGVNIHSLSKDVQEKLLISFFSNEGIEYNMGRVPMGATDFSKGPYTYDDGGKDLKLKRFKLKDVDTKYKIPYIKKAMELSNNTLQLIATPWTAPPWMKTNDDYSWIGFLKDEYYQLFADYYIKFLDAYAEYGVQIWGVTTGNEPKNGYLPLPLPSMGWSIESTITWLSENLGPTIRKSKYNNTKIFIHDDQKFFLPEVQNVFNNDKALKYVDGVAYHWYWNYLTPENFINYAKTPKKDIIILPNEAATGFFTMEPVVLGDWGRAEKYIEDIILNLKYDTNGWMDFNLVVNQEGGYVYTGFATDACIVVNAKADEFYKQPMYYAMGHFSKFLKRDSYRIKTRIKSSSIQAISFKRPDEGIAVIIYNNGDSDEVVTVHDPNKGRFSVGIKHKSINTILYW